MTATTNRYRKTFGLGGFASAFVLAAALAACAPVHSDGPDQVHANNPSVTYNYQTDQELLQAMQKAATYCSQYQTTMAKSGPITSNGDGTSTVAFECVPVTPPQPAVATAPRPALPMTYTYYNAQELLRASDQAELTCMNMGKRSAATITANPDGSKTASFRCVL